MSNRPDHSSHGQTSVNLHNTWTKDTKTKTARCRICYERIENWSWQCSRCTKRICSECCADDPSGVNSNKQSGKDHLRKGCWCRFPSHFNPAMKRFQSALPPKQTAQMAKDRAAKQKAMETSRRRKEAADRGNVREGPSKKPVKHRESDEGSSAESSDSEDTDYSESKHPPTLRPRKDRQIYKESPSDGDDSGSDAFDPFESAEPGSGIKAPVVVSDDEEDDESDISPIRQSKGEGKKTKARPTTSASASTGGGLDFSLPAGFKDPHGPKQKGKKRKTDVAQLDQDKPEATPSRKMKKAKKSSPLEDGHTLIVGAGIIGLFTAYELATRCLTDGINHTITVVEIRDGVCELASGQCAGFIGHRGMPREDEWLRLFGEAEAGWKALMHKVPGNSIGLINDETYFAEDAGEDDQEGIDMPSWFKPRPIMHVSEDQKYLARIETKSMASWLYEQCGKMGVNFMFNQCLEAAQPRSAGKGWSVSNGDPNQPFSDESTTMEVSNIVIAAGPYTTHIVRELFNGMQTTGLGNRHCDQLWIEVPLIADEESEVGITVKTTDDWSADAMTMAVRPGGTAIEISAAPRQTANEDIHQHVVRAQPAIDTTPLEDLAGEYLGIRRGSQLQVSARGGGTVSVGRGKQPRVGQLWMRNDSSRELVETPNVWLSYGFGRFGTTLAPGAARSLVKAMMGEQ